jgi:NADPH-dependent 2,4-dienoyl-CoA reductase/sulfur reductase-like enzyme
VSLPIAIVGNGGAAAEAVLALRANGHRGEIHLFADNDHAPYNPMLGTYVVSGKIPAERAFPFGDAQTFYGANAVTTHLGAPVAHLDAEARELTTASDETYGYENCLVASGAKPAVPPIRGLREALAESRAPDERRVFTLQTLDDALALKHVVDGLLATAGRAGAAEPGAARPLRAAVVGASFAGVRIASVLHELGFKVSLAEREASIVPLAAHPEAARLMEAHLLAEGYELRLGAALAGVQVGAGADDGTPGKIRLDFGALPGAADPGGAGGTACDDSAAQDEVDLLVVCTGNRPALSFLTPGQVDVGAGIFVDEQMRSSIPTLRAAGDVAQGKNLLSGRREIIGLWSSARYQGRAAGRSLAGAPSGYLGGLPHNITRVGRLLFASMGCVDDYDKVTITHDQDSWQVRLSREGRLVGVNLVDCCLSAGVMKQAFLRAATGATSDLEATWTSFNG